MTNALTTADTTALSGAAAVNPFLAAGDGAGGGVFMKFVGQSGDFLFGQGEEEMQHGTQLAANIEGASYVWTFWWDGEVLEQKSYPVIEQPRAFEQEPDWLPDDYDEDAEGMSLEDIRTERKNKDSTFMDGWSCQGQVTLRSLEGEMEEYTLKLNAGVGMTAFQRMLGAYGRLRSMKAGLTPIIELGARQYKSKIKSVGKRYAPELKIVDWRSEADLAAAAGEDPEDYGDEEVMEEGTEEAVASEETSEEADAQPRGRAARRGARGRNLG